MKKRLLIICSIIAVLLAGFQFPIYAETTPPDYSSSTSIMSSTPLDQYFYDNYELLPYIQSSGRQYINTGIVPSNSLRIDVSFSDLIPTSSGSAVFGSNGAQKERFYFNSQINNDLKRFGFGLNTYEYSFIFNDYSIYTVSLDRNKAYINNSLVHEFDEEEFTGTYTIYIFANHNQQNINSYSECKLYRLSIYDYEANEGEGALVRDYYPARSKSGGVIGLYDAVSKTFVTTSGSVPFASPTGDPVNLSLGANITQFLSGSLSWIGAIFEGINEMPIIWVFIAIALAGVMFRWARRIVHF